MRQLLIAGSILALMPATALADDMFRGVSSQLAHDGLMRIQFDNIEPGVMQMEAGDRVTLNFGSGFEAELDRIGLQEMGSRVWVGRIADHTIQNRVIITQTNGYTFGQIQAPDGLYWIYPGRNGHEILRVPEDAVEIEFGDDGLIPTGDMLEFVASEGHSHSLPDVGEAVAVGSNGTMDIAVFYSDSFVTRWGLATGGRIQYLMALLDQALIDSETGLRARLVHTDSVSISTETAELAQTLYNLTGLAPSGESVTEDLSALRTARDTYGADLVAIVMRSQTGQSSCGVGWVNGGSDDDISPTADDHLGFSVSADWIRDDDFPSGSFSFCSDSTFAHEVGHNMGFAHNVEDASSGIGMGVRDYAHGHRVDGEFRTIMSYNSSTGESRVNYFSNPDITLCPGGAACGIAAPGEVSHSGINSPATSDPADNARAAREESLNIADFRAEAPRVVSSVLPITRTVEVGTTATAFASVINPAATGSTATACGLRLPGASGSQFSYQTTTSANALTGTPDTTTSIAAGATQNFIFSVTSAAAFDDNVDQPSGFTSGNNETELFIEAFCGNRRSAEYRLGLNSLTFRATTSAPTDIIALAATLAANPGYVVVPTTGNMVGVFSVAISNVGVAGSVTVTADTGSESLAVDEIEICQTDSSGACTDTRENSKTLTVAADGTATFGIFVRGTGGAIANDPADNRVFVRFAAGGDPVGATSVAVRTD
ncbi:reprolysin-like metallopeptidase [Hyphobacterium sp.]|uniref:reprolysin-like metallopeptidase n=1 Tax=Hyphobacterium sp. TaxID=2004662 RepID=UPI003BAD4ECA